ncbi:CvpA family protein [Salisediminibacterium selenitireducens]|uniref:Colicin V production protein n=1 Tax=Bacillus selenitireducens (strain ATCC 700615 / DSM 15326 / MLS10) TaxID=439292 RepID=D6XSW2_BACIE|nr:CvpA family protein [Salisediminibacterium selenitireducens]ADH98898.1 Colicin V production protein [[Bacillus] selenitireducens MLS10]
MVTWLIVFGLLIGFLAGYRRGIVLQLVHIIGLVVAFIVALRYYQPLGEELRLLIPFPQLSTDSGLSIMNEEYGREMVFYRGIAFAGLFIVTRIVTQIIGSMLDFLANLPIIHFFNQWAGALFGFVEAVLIIVVLLHLGALIQWDFLQGAIQQSSLAQWFFSSTPVISERIVDWFTTEMNG